MPVLIEELTLHVDEKGKGFEIQGMQKSRLLKENHVEDIVLQTIRPHQKRGNHYHVNKTEWFLPIRGFVILTWSDVDDSKETHTVVMETDLQNQKLYQIQPKTCHTLENKSEEDFYMLAMSSKDFHPKDNLPC